MANSAADAAVSILGLQLFYILIFCGPCEYRVFGQQHDSHHFTAIIQLLRQFKLRTGELDDFVGAKFYCPNALADGNQHFWIMEKRLEFSSTVLSTLSVPL